jgi:hypothetical protein
MLEIIKCDNHPRAIQPSMIYSGSSEAREASQIELSRLLGLFVLPRTASDNILRWTTSSSAAAAIEWNHAGIIECAPWIEKQFHQVFCRSGSMAIACQRPMTRSASRDCKLCWTRRSSSLQEADAPCPVVRTAAW